MSDETCGQCGLPLTQGSGMWTDDEELGDVHEFCLENTDRGKGELAFMVENDIDVDDYDRLYDAVTKQIEEFGTQALNAMIAHVEPDL